MIDIIEAARFGGMSVLVALPMFCLQDIKKRKIPDIAWQVLAIVNIPALYFLYTDIHGIGKFNLAISAVAAALYVFFRYLNLYGGADAKILATIAFVAPLNPVNLFHPFFQIFFFFSFAIAMCFIPLYMKSRWYNPIRGVPVMVIIFISYIVAIIWHGAM